MKKDLGQIIIEGWHNKVNCMIGKGHPYVFELVEVFKMEQASTEVTLHQLAAGGLLQNPQKCIQSRGREY